MGMINGIPTYTGGPNHKAVFSITEPEEVGYTLTTDGISCNGGSDGSITVRPYGGTGSYDIEYWLSNSGDTIKQLLAVDTSGICINGLSHGIYNFYLTDSNGCDGSIGERSLEVTQPSKPVSISESSITNNIKYGGNSGNAVFLIEGENLSTEQSYYCCFDSLGLNVGNVSILDNPDFCYVKLDSLAAGQYTFMAFDTLYAGDRNPDADSCGCFSKYSFSISQPDPIEITFYYEPVICNGDKTMLVANVSGGTTYDNPYKDKYDYLWYKSVDGSNIEISSSDEPLEVNAGLYRLIVSDSNQVKDSADVIINEPEIVRFTLVGDTLACYAQTNGVIEIKPEGGAGAYNFSYRRDDNDPFVEWPELINTAGTFIKGLSAGNYEFILSDTLGCGNHQSSMVSIIQPSEPLRISNTEINDNIQNNGKSGNARFAVDGGSINESGLYNIFCFDMTGEQSGVVEVTAGPDNEGVIVSVESLAAGTYKLMAFDNNYDGELSIQADSCSCMSAYQFVIAEPQPLLLSLISGNEILCHGDMTTITANASGGLSYKTGNPYNYNWYKIEGNVETALEEFSDSVANLFAGNYRVSVSDRVGVSETAVINIDQPEPLLISYNAGTLRCDCDADGWIDVDVTGGVKPYRYEWSTNNDADTIKKVENLIGGNYLVRVVDANQCELNQVIALFAPDGLKVETNSIDLACNGIPTGSVNVSVTGGTAPYQMAWDDASEDFLRENLGAGIYGYKVSDAAGCYVSGSVEITQPEPLSINLNSDLVMLCRGQSYDVDVTMDDAVRYTWLLDGNEYSRSPELSLTEGGLYDIRIETAAGCHIGSQVRIERCDVEIGSDFLIASNAAIDGNVRVVNITNPIPDRIEWIYPKEITDVVREDSACLELRFHEYGSHTVGLLSHLGECSKLQQKQINIITGAEMSLIDETSDDILSFIVTPGKGNLSFTVTVELSKPDDITLILYDGVTGANIDVRGYKDERLYSISYNDLGLSTGSYILQLITSNDRRTYRIMIK